MKSQRDNIFMGIAFCVSAHFVFSMMSAIAKFLAQEYDVIEIAFYRNLCVVVPFILFLVISRRFDLLKTKRPGLMASRSIVAGVLLVLIFKSVSLLPISYATVIFFMSSLLTPILAFFFLKEHMGIHRWAAVFIGMCGVIVVAQPSGAVSMAGLAVAMCAAVLFSLQHVTLRGLKTESAITGVFYLSCAGVVMQGALMPWFAKGIDLSDLWMFASIAALASMGQFLLANAYKYAPAVVVTPFSYSSLIWVTGIDLYVWQYDLDFVPVFTGASLIIGAQLYIMYREYVNKGNKTPLSNHEGGASYAEK